MVPLQAVPKGVMSDFEGRVRGGGRGGVGVEIGRV